MGRWGGREFLSFGVFLFWVVWRRILSFGFWIFRRNAVLCLEVGIEEFLGGFVCVMIFGKKKKVLVFIGNGDGK